MPEVPIIAFQGEPGAYSEQAARQFFGDEITPLACHSFGEIFKAVESGRAGHGILPVENSLAGTVVPAYDELLEHELVVQGEEMVHVRHCLMAPPGTALEEIHRAVSHPQALAQCRKRLERLDLEPVPYYDTAGAARDLATNPEPGSAAIASELAARTYGLEVLVEDLQDEPDNYTRFFILGTENAPRRDPGKTSIIFTTRHTPGSLVAILNELAERRLNLTKIESRPMRDQPWHYYFYVDFEGHIDDPPVSAALTGILKQAATLRVLGSYPAVQGVAKDSERSR